MGIDGKITTGSGVLINPFYLSDTHFKFLVELSEKYESLLDCDGLNGVTRKSPIIVWEDRSRSLFPVGTSDRRPLILNDEKQLEAMRPTDEKMNLDNEKVWEPSYSEFVIRLNDCFGYEERVLNLILDEIKKRVIRYDDDYAGFHKLKEEEGKLTKEEFETLRSILIDKNYCLVGEYMKYTLE